MDFSGTQAIIWTEQNDISSVLSRKMCTSPGLVLLLFSSSQCGWDSTAAQTQLVWLGTAVLMAERQFVSQPVLLCMKTQQEWRVTPLEATTAYKLQGLCKGGEKNLIYCATQSIFLFRGSEEPLGILNIS